VEKPMQLKGKQKLHAMMCNATNHSIRMTIMDIEQDFFINTCGSHGDGYRRSLPTLWRNILLELQQIRHTAYSSTLKMGEVCCFKISRNFYQTILHHIPQLILFKTFNINNPKGIFKCLSKATF
jgi:hypothetical protein